MPNENEDGSQTPSADPAYVKAEDIGNIVNAAVSSHLKRSLAGAIESALKPALEQFKASMTPAPAGEETSDEKKKGKQSPEMLAMAKQIEDMQKALVAEKERTAAAEKKQREDRAFSELRSSLEGKVRPELLDMVAKHLFVVEGRVQVDDQGNSLFKGSRLPYQGATEAEEYTLPLRSGIEDFLKSDAAKPFLPAPSAGAGTSPLPKRGATPTPGSSDFSKPATTDAEKLRRAAEKERLVRDKLGIR